MPPFAFSTLLAALALLPLFATRTAARRARKGTLG